ncbi:hypothetical protein EON65_58410, partial [archaeon]
MLYDDLPAPQSSGSKQKPEPVIDPTNPYADLFAPLVVQESRSTDKNDDSGQLDAIQITKAKPTKPAVSLVFKPRQALVKTEKHTHNAHNNNTSQHSETAKSSSDHIPVQNNLQSIGEQKGVLENKESNHRDRTDSINIKDPPQPPSQLPPEEEDDENEPFNTIASFEVEHPYDPRRPNDYSSLVSEREENARIAVLETENRKKLQAIDKERQEREKLRRDAAE